ncbi:MAG: hypothetical protein ACD_83C00099G0003 [uncultured bacterium]|nr:MAG: hypothetical protein ACD_83C00099G0003 [uncultured bacterium]
MPTLPKAARVLRRPGHRPIVRRKVVIKMASESLVDRQTGSLINRQLKLIQTCGLVAALLGQRERTEQEMVKERERRRIGIRE